MQGGEKAHVLAHLEGQLVCAGVGDALACQHSLGTGCSPPGKLSHPGDEEHRAHIIGHPAAPKEGLWGGEGAANVEGKEQVAGGVVVAAAAVV